MRTTLDIDEKLLEDAVKLSGVSSKTAAVEAALDEYVKRLLRIRLARRIEEGDLGIDLTIEELRKMRGCE